MTRPRASLRACSAPSSSTMSTALHLHGAPFTKANPNAGRSTSKPVRKQRWAALRSRAVADVVSTTGATTTAVVAVPAVPDIVTPAAAPAPITTDAVAIPDTAAAQEAAADLLKGLKSSTDGALSSLGGISDAAGDASAQLSQAAGATTAQLSQAAEATTAQLNAAASNITGAAAGAASSITGAAAGAASSITGAAADAQEQLAKAASGLTSGLQGATSSITGTASQALGTASSAFSATYDELSTELSGFLSAADSTFKQVEGTVSSTTGELTSTVNSIKSAVQTAVYNAACQVTAAYDSTAQQVSAAVAETTAQVLDSLPEPARDAVLAVAGVTQAVAGQVAAHPVPALAITGAVVVPLYVKSYVDRYGGYAGELDPSEVRALLLEQESLLVDIRGDEEREEQGVPELKLAARFRAVAFPLNLSLDPVVARRSANPSQLALQTYAAYISGLKEVQGPLTRFIIMDTTGSDKAREVARALRDIGVAEPYIMAGGFRRWQERELPVAESGRYDSSVALLIGDEIEQITNTAAEKLSPLKEPSLGVPVAAGSALLAVAAYNYHYTLQYLGVLSLLLTATNKLLSYESPGALLEEVMALIPAGAAGSAVAGELEAVAEEVLEQEQAADEAQEAVERS